MQHVGREFGLGDRRAIDVVGSGEVALHHQFATTDHDDGVDVAGGPLFEDLVEAAQAGGIEADLGRSGARPSILEVDGRGGAVLRVGFRTECQKCQQEHEKAFHRGIAYVVRGGRQGLLAWVP